MRRHAHILARGPSRTMLSFSMRGFCVQAKSPARGIELDILLTTVRQPGHPSQTEVSLGVCGVVYGNSARFEPATQGV